VAQELPSAYDRFLRISAILLTLAALGLIYWSVNRTKVRLETGTETLAVRLELAPLVAKARGGFPLDLFDRDELRKLGTVVYATLKKVPVELRTPNPPASLPQDKVERDQLLMEIDHRARFETWQESLDQLGLGQGKVVPILVGDPGEPVSFLIVGPEVKRARQIVEQMRKAELITSASIWEPEMELDPDQPGHFETPSGLILEINAYEWSLYFGGMLLYHNGELKASPDELEVLASRVFFNLGPPPVKEKAKKKAPPSEGGLIKGERKRKQKTD